MIEKVREHVCRLLGKVHSGYDMNILIVFLICFQILLNEKRPIKIFLILAFESLSYSY